MAKTYSVAQLREFAVNKADEFEITRQTLYDTLTYNAAGQSNLTFFQNPVGQAGKTLEDTNMEAAGQLPAPKYFLVESIEIRFFPGVNPVVSSNFPTTQAVTTNFTNDVYAFQKAGYLDFFIGSKSYLTEAPLGKFPPKTNLTTEFGAGFQMKQAIPADEASQIIGDYAAMSGRPYYIKPQIALIPNQNFNVTANWATPVALPSTTDARMNITLDGLLYRLSQ